jgi:hypothetical protein
LALLVRCIDLKINLSNWFVTSQGDTKRTEFKLKSELKNEIKLQRVFPNESWNLIIEFSNGEFGRIGRAAMGPEFDFLSHPQKFRSFVFNQDFVEWLPIAKQDTGYYAGRNIWKRTARISSQTLYERCEKINHSQTQNELLCLSAKNQAPTQQHASHHEYSVYIRPFNLWQAFSLGETIGNAQFGGGIDYSLPQLLSKPNWKEHFTLSGCEWAIPIIEENKNSAREIMIKLAQEVSRRASQ